jgi:hypothetical protein
VALPRVLHTATFRLALFYAVLFGISAVVLFATVYWSMTGYATEQIRAAVEAEVTSLVDDARNEGIEHLAQTIEERLRGPERRSSYYLLLDATGQRITGNIPTVAPTAGWREFGAPESEGNNEGDETRTARSSASACRFPTAAFSSSGTTPSSCASSANSSSARSPGRAGSPLDWRCLAAPR